MIRVGYGVLEVGGSKVEIMTDISVILHHLKNRGILTDEDIDAIMKYTKMSRDELEADYKKSVKECKSKLLKSLSEVLDDMLPESE